MITFRRFEVSSKIPYCENVREVCYCQGEYAITEIAKFDKNLKFRKSDFSSNLFPNLLVYKMEEENYKIEVSIYGVEDLSIFKDKETIVSLYEKIMKTKIERLSIEETIIKNDSEIDKIIEKFSKGVAESVGEYFNRRIDFYRKHLDKQFNIIKNNYFILFDNFLNNWLVGDDCDDYRN